MWFIAESTRNGAYCQRLCWDEIDAYSFNEMGLVFCSKFKKDNKVLYYLSCESFSIPLSPFIVKKWMKTKIGFNSSVYHQYADQSRNCISGIFQIQNFDLQYAIELLPKDHPWLNFVLVSSEALDISRFPLEKVYHYSEQNTTVNFDFLIKYAMDHHCQIINYSDYSGGSSLNHWLANDQLRSPQ